MDIHDAQRRDRVLRAYFLGRDWDEGVEPRLVREVVLASRELLPEYPYLVGHEWEPAPGRTSGGRGDLLFTDGHGAYAVVEVKSILGSGSNTSRRNRVEDQAREYGDLVPVRFDDALDVQVFVYTDDFLFPGLRSPLRREAGRLPRTTSIRSGALQLDQIEW